MEKEKRFELIHREGNGLTKPTCTILMDTATGVQYLMVQDGNGAGLTPLIDRDGRPLTWRPAGQ